MRVIVDRPPNFSTVVAVFPDAQRDGVIFTYGAAIYNPSNAKITRELMAHEEVHSERQGAAPEVWWENYLKDDAFRLNEEIVAHHVEYRAFCKRHGSKRAEYLGLVAQRLSGPLYGGMLNRRDAELAVLTGRIQR